MPVTLQYSLQKLEITPNDLFQYDKREKKGVVNNLLDKALTETVAPSPRGEFIFASAEIRRAVDIYGEQFCLFVEDTLNAFWAARAGVAGVGLPIWLQNSSNNYTAPAVEAVMGEAVAGYMMEKIFNARLCYRPRGRSPDIYMILPSGQGATVEAKATISIRDDSLQNKLAEALLEILTIWAHIDSVQRLADLAGFCAAVAIGQSRVKTRILRLEFKP